MDLIGFGNDIVIPLA